MHSSDGGLTWVDLGEPIPAGIHDLASPSASLVIAADVEGNLFRSTNAGQAWSQTFDSPGPSPSFLSSAELAFPDAQTGYFGAGAGFVVKTTDGGATWSQISSGSGHDVNDMDRFPNGNLIAVGPAGTVLHSTGSTPWTIGAGFTTEEINAVDVVGPQAVVVAERTGRIHRSSDGGATWIAGAATPTGLIASDLHFTTLLDGWVIGSGFSIGALFHTTNGGDSWTPVTTFIGGYAALDFEGAHGWAANSGGLFYRTTDNGETWESQNIPGSPIVLDMDFFDVSIGYAVGWQGYAARSDDAGLTWDVLPTPDDEEKFTDIYLVGANELWLATADGKAYYTATGGQNWAVLDSETQGFGSFAAIVASPSGDAWMGGYQGFIEHFAGPPPPPLNRPPEASFTFAVNGLAVDFTDTSIDPDGSVLSWSWDFGDETGSTEPNPSHVYQSADTYIVRLTVTDDDGETGSGGRFIVVQPGPGGTFGDFTEVTPLDPLFVTPQDEDFWVVATAPADYDGDGDLDVAVLGYYVVYNESVEHRLVLLRNGGAVSPTEWEFVYVDVPLGSLDAGASDMAWGDPDGDGDQDLVLGTNGNTVLYRNDSGTLVLTDTELPAYYEDNDQADFDLHSISWADYDNDGDVDLLLPSVYRFDEGEYDTALLRNDGPNGTGGWVFSEANAGFTPTRHAQTTWADYDGDEDLDLLLVNLAPLGDEGFIRRYRNDGGGVFTGEDILGTLSVEHGESQWGDYDGDGDLDVLVAGNIRELDGTYDTVLRVYRNDAETYVANELISCLGCEGWFDMSAATWADYDSDGDVDILLAGSYNPGSQIEGRAKIYANDNGVFTDSGNQLPAPSASGSRGGTFSWLDLDGDGDLDYFIAGQYWVPGGNGLVEAQMHVYRNDAEGVNVAPSAPVDLTVTSGPNNSLLVVWGQAHDDSTPEAALTYDLEIYRDGELVSSPRRLPQHGSVGSVEEWKVLGLPDGQYTFALRAVDSAYNGGPRIETKFTVGGPTDTAGDLPMQYALHRVYPNPFRGGTTFRFALPERAHVNLSVYDVAGRRVAQLANEVRTAGVHVVPWQARDLASGTYFVRLSAGAFTKTERVQYLK